MNIHVFEKRFWLYHKRIDTSFDQIYGVPSWENHSVMHTSKDLIAILPIMWFISKEEIEWDLAHIVWY